jgi:hypothetical protein
MEAHCRNTNPIIGFLTIGWWRRWNQRHNHNVGLRKMRPRYVIVLCATCLLIGFASCWLYIKKHTVRFGPFDRTAYDRIEDVWQPIMFAVTKEGTNRICTWCSEGPTTMSTNYDSLVARISSFDVSVPVALTVSTNWTITEIDDLITVTKKAGCKNVAVFWQAEPSTNQLPWHGDRPFREVRISPSRKLGSCLYEWYIESERNRVQPVVGAAGRPSAQR